MDRESRLDMLRRIAAAFDRHDLGTIMASFADDAVFEGPTGPDRWGRRFVGRDAVERAFAGRFDGIPDVRYLEDEHFVDGDRGASTWILRGTSRDGERLDINGCDLWAFRGDLVVRKDSYWKRRTP